MPVTTRTITILGAGSFGLWQAYALARAGHRVRLIEASAEPFAQAASLYGGVMLAPEREAETAPPLLRELGHEGVAAWRALYPQLVCAGSLVVAAARESAELDRFAKMTRGHARLDSERLQKLEPELAGRFPSALFFADEAHMPAPAALEFMLGKVCDAGVEVVFGVDRAPADRRYGHRLPRTCGPRRAFRSARRARRAPHRAIGRDRAAAGRSSSCTRASRSTSCRGATAAS